LKTDLSAFGGIYLCRYCRDLFLFLEASVLYIQKVNSEIIKAQLIDKNIHPAAVIIVFLPWGSCLLSTCVARQARPEQSAE